MSKDKDDWAPNPYPLINGTVLTSIQPNQSCTQLTQSTQIAEGAVGYRFRFKSVVGTQDTLWWWKGSPTLKAKVSIQVWLGSSIRIVVDQPLVKVSSGPTWRLNCWGWLESPKSPGYPFFIQNVDGSDFLFTIEAAP